MGAEILLKFGKKIRKLRLEKNLSQEELAERTGFHRTYIGMVERGERNISVINLNKIAKALDVLLFDLLNF
ncbi:MAG: helix-turn-helix transcriptional regulator [Chloroflexi bacterium]|nr:helix-turn-helix transcriptional regulator [Chloroflexota bacterium]